MLVLHGLFVLQVQGGGGGCLPGGQSKGARLALVEIHVALAGPWWLLCIIVAEGLVLGHPWSKSQNETDTRLLRGCLDACVTFLLWGCSDYTRLLWPVRSAHP